MMDVNPLQSAVAGKVEPIYMQGPDVIEYYKDTYGGRGWIGKLAETLAGRQSGIPAKKDLPYLAARRSIERFEKGQFKDMRKYGKELETVGKQLPPIGQRIPGNQITVKVEGKQYDTRNPEGRKRDWSATFTGPDAYDFAAAPDWKKFFKQLSYPEYVIEEFDGDDSSGVEIVSVA